MNRKELVAKMVAAYNKAQPSHWVVDEGMDAALSVAIDELLKEPDLDECNEPVKPCTYGALTHGSIRKIFASRRAKLERVKTPAENVADFLCTRLGHASGMYDVKNMADEIVALVEAQTCQR